MNTTESNIVKNFSYLLFFSGSFNIILAAPLMVPRLAEPYFSLLWSINQFFGLGGMQPVAPQSGVSALLVNTAGIDLVLIGAFVIYAGFAPMQRLFIPVANGTGRIIFAVIVCYYVVEMNIARIVVWIAVIDLLISAGFVYFLMRLRQVRQA